MNGLQRKNWTRQEVVEADIKTRDRMVGQWLDDIRYYRPDKDYIGEKKFHFESFDKWAWYSKLWKYAGQCFEALPQLNKVMALEEYVSGKSSDLKKSISKQGALCWFEGIESKTRNH